MQLEKVDQVYSFSSGDLILRPVEYFSPKSLTEALKLLFKHKDKARVLAGNTDLLIQMKQKEISPNYLVDLKRIPDLANIHLCENWGLRLGALATISEIESSVIVKENYTILSEVAKAIGSPQIRNRGTIGGNLCRAAPSADFAPILIAMGAQLKIVGLRTKRTVCLEDFFIGPSVTILKHDEVLKEIEIPPPTHNWGAVYLRHHPREAMDLAVASAAVFIVLSRKACKELKIVLGSVASTPIRAKEAEKVLLGEVVTDALIEESAKVAISETSPISDIYGADWYKREITYVLVKRAIMQTLEKCMKQNNEI